MKINMLYSSCIQISRSLVLFTQHTKKYRQQTEKKTRELRAEERIDCMTRYQKHRMTTRIKSRETSFSHPRCCWCWCSNAVQQKGARYREVNELGQRSHQSTWTASGNCYERLFFSFIDGRRRTHSSLILCRKFWLKLRDIEKFN